MLKVKVGNDILEYGEDNLDIDDVETTVRAAISVHHSANKTDRIWGEIKKWAEEWDEYPSSGEYDGWDAVIAAVGEKLRIVPTDAQKTQTENWAKLTLKLKRAWVKVSEDPTEAGQESNSLYAASLELREALLAIHGETHLARMLNVMMPTVFTVSNNYLGGKYDCHQNAAKEARDAFHGFDFKSLLNDAEEQTDRERYMAAEWDQLAFSSRL